MFDESFFHTGDPNAPAGPQFVAFRYEPVQNEAKTQIAGRPIFDSVEMVKVISPGANDEIDKPATDLERTRFKTQYSAFLAGPPKPDGGTPLAEWPALTRTQAAELTALDILTVEQLAAMPTDLRQRFGPNVDALIERASTFLSRAHDNSTSERLAAENLRLRERNAELETNYRTLAAQVEQLIQERDHG